MPTYQSAPTGHIALPFELRVGFDLVQISQIQGSIQRFGDRFLRRIFTERELDYAHSAADLLGQRLAARFAAKEATLKALRITARGIGWRDIEVERHSDGDCALALHGRAAQLAQPCLGQPALSLSHEGDYAGAVVTALCLTDPASTHQPQPPLPQPEHAMNPSETTEARIRAVLRDHGRLNTDVATLALQTDLYQSGMTSHASVNVMLALEAAFDIEFPDQMLKRSVFVSIESISIALAQLGNT